MASLGSLSVQLGLDTASYQRGLTQAEYLTAKFSTATAAKFAAIGEVVGRLTGAVIDGVRSAVTSFPRGVLDAITELDKLDERATKIGLPVDLVQSFAYALRFVGKSGEEADAALVKFQKNFDEARANIDSGGGKAFASLGLSAKQFGEDARGALEAVLDKLSNVRDQASRVSIEGALFGKKNTGVSVAFEDGAESLRGAREELAAFGVLAKADIAAAAGSMNDDFEKLGVASMGLKFAFAEALLPSARAVAAQLFETKKGSTNLYTSIRELGKDTTLIDWAETATSVVVKLVQEFINFGKEVRSVVGYLEIAKLRAEDMVTNSRLRPVSMQEAREGKGFFGLTFNDKPKELREAGSRTIAAEIDFIKKEIIRQTTDAGPQLQDAVDKFFAGVRKKFANPGKPRTRGADVDIDALLGGPAKADPFDGLLQELARESSQLQFNLDNWDKYRGNVKNAKEALLDFELTRGKFSPEERAKDKLPPIAEDDARLAQARELTRRISAQASEESQRKAITAVRDQIDAINAEREALHESNVEREVAVKLQTLLKAGTPPEQVAPVREELRRAVFLRERDREIISAREFENAERGVTQALQDEIEAMSQTTLRSQELRVEREQRAKLDAQVLDPSGNLKVTLEAFAEFANASEKATQQQLAFVRVRYAAERDMFVSLAKFARDYYDDVNNNAKVALSGVQTAISSLEEAWVNVFNTGKHGWREMLQSWLNDFNRFAFRKVIASIFEGSGIAGKDSDGVSSIFNLLRKFNPGQDNVTLEDGSTFGNKGTDTSGNDFGTLSSAVMLLLSKFGGAGAVGMDMRAGGWYIAGDQGGEAVIPKQDMVAMQLNQFSALNKGSGGSNVIALTQHVNYTVSGALDRTTQEQTALRNNAQARRALSRVT